VCAPLLHACAPGSPDSCAGCMHVLNVCAVQKALVQESVVQGLSKPNNLPETTVVSHQGRTITLRGFDNAHWAALKWVSKLIESEFKQLQDLEGCDDAALATIKQQCARPACSAPVATAAQPCRATAAHGQLRGRVQGGDGADAPGRDAECGPAQGAQLAPPVGDAWEVPVRRPAVALRCCAPLLRHAARLVPGGSPGGWRHAGHSPQW
jgi:hypothetical protein